jgi:hypothetical protein
LALKENDMTRQFHRLPRASITGLRVSAFAAVLFSLVAALSTTTAIADDRGYRDNDGDDHRVSRQSDARLRCESKNARYQLCQVAVRGNVRLVREHSRADCVEGRSWGWSAAGIWVDHGCRGEFTYTPRMAGGYGGGRDDRRARDSRDDWRDERRDGGSWGSGGRGGRGELRCESNRGRTVFCPAPVQGKVVLAKQLSHAPCRYGDTWTFDQRGISVRDGCRAEFRFETRGW